MMLDSFYFAISTTEQTFNDLVVGIGSKYFELKIFLSKGQQSWLMKSGCILMSFLLLKNGVEIGGDCCRIFRFHDTVDHCHAVEARRQQLLQVCCRDASGCKNGHGCHCPGGRNSSGFHPFATIGGRGRKY